MNIPFNLKFTIFDENKDVSKKQKKIRKDLIDFKLKNIIKNLFNENDNYKFLDRDEPSLSSLDEKKQLRLLFEDIIINDLKKYEHSLHFHQLESWDHTFFTLKELKYIGSKIKTELEELLQYEIDEPVIYIETSYI